MTHFSLVSSLSRLNRKGSSKLLKVFLNVNNYDLNSISRQFRLSTPGFCVSSEKDAVAYHSPAPNNKVGMKAASPASTESQQNSRTTQYEPTLIANPNAAATTTKPTDVITQGQGPSQSSQSSQPHTSNDRKTTTDLRAKAIQQDLQLSKRDALNDLLNQVDPRTLSKLYYFDSLALFKKLEARGFSREQAEGCVECLLEIVGDTLEHQAKHMITKSEQRIVEQQLQTEIMSVKKDMVLLQKSEFSALRTETEKISIDIDRIQTHFQDEVVKLKGQFTLDVNLERGRAVEAHAVGEKNLQMLNNKIETEIAHLKTTYEVYRNDIFKYAGGTVLTCTTLIIGFMRLWS